MRKIEPGLKAGFAETVEAIDETGRKVAAVNWVLDEDEFEQVRRGYRCLNCMEVFDAPFPDKCFVCGFAVREKQAEEFVRQFMGEHRYGPSITPDMRREERERETWTPSGTTQILLPGRDF